MRPPISTLFPYTTLFRSSGNDADSSLLAPLVDWIASAPTMAPAARATAPAAPRMTTSRRRIAQQRGELGDARPLQDLAGLRSEEHTSELQSRLHLVCRLL